MLWRKEVFHGDALSGQALNQFACLQRKPYYCAHTGIWPILWMSALNMLLLLDCIKFVHPYFVSSFVPEASLHSWAVCCSLVVREEAVFLSPSLWKTTVYRTIVPCVKKVPQQWSPLGLWRKNSGTGSHLRSTLCRGLGLRCKQHR